MRSTKPFDNPQGATQAQVRCVKPAALLLALALCACSAPQQGTLRIVGRSSVSSLDHQRDGDYFSEAILRNVYETLVDFHPVEGFTPRLATSWTNPRPTRWLFELRKGVRFHDGRPFVAQDVRYTIQRALAPQSPLRFDLPSVTDVRVLGDHVVEIETEQPAPLLLNQLADVMIVPQGLGPELATRALGTGPYRVASFEPRQGLVLEASNAYWADPPLWRRATFRFEPEATARVDLLLSNAADVAEEPPGEGHARLQADHQVRLVDRIGPDLAVLGLRVEARPDNPFSRPGVRSALARVLDRRRLVDEDLADRAHPLWQLAPRVVFGHMSQFRQGAPDRPRAREELRRAGFPDGFRTPLVFTERDRRLARGVARQAGELGIELELVQLAWELLKTRLEAGQAGAWVTRYSFPNLDASDALNDLHTRDEGFGRRNASGYSDPQLDRLLEEAASELGPGRRIELLGQALEKAQDAHVLIPLCTIPEVLAVSRRIEVAENSRPHSFTVDDFRPVAP